MATQPTTTIRRKMRRAPTTPTTWTPPSIPTLIDRIETALHRRQTP